MSKTKVATTASDMNVAIIVGEVTTEPVSRELANGEVVSSFDVTTSTDEGRLSVPISVDGDAADVEKGIRVLVAGVTRRRFFRAGSGLASRTELLAHAVIPVRRKAQVERTVRETIANLEDVAGV